MDTFLAALPAGTSLFVNEILPYTSGNDTQAATIRTLNANYATWCAENGATLIQCHDAMGQVRASTGELDDLATAYNHDGAHLTTAGVDKLAEIVAQALLAASWMPELVENGSFSTDLSGWTDASSGTGTATWTEGGIASITRASLSDQGRLRQAIATVPGRQYRVAVKATGSYARFLVGTTAGGFDIVQELNPTTFDFTATTATTHIELSNSNTGTSDYDSVSIREIA